MRSILILVLAVLAAIVVWFALLREPAPTDPLAPARAPAVPSPVPAQELEAPPTVAEPAIESPRRVEDRAPVEAAAAAQTRLDVRVVAKGTQRPLVRARIGLGSTEPNSTTREVNRSIGTLGEALWTDGDGSAAFDVDAGIAMKLTASRGETLARVAYVNVAPLRPGETRAIVVEMEFEPDLVFFGRVLDRETRAPIAGAAIVGEEPPGTADYGTTDANGVFRVAIRTWNTVGLRLRARGFAEHWVGPIAGHDSAEEALEILLDRAPKLMVEVRTADRAPLADAVVRIESWISDMSSGTTSSNRYLDALSWSAATDAAGVATFDELPPGASLRGSVLRGNKVLRKEADPFTLAPGETRRVTWVLGAGGSIQGIVREADGSPAPNFEVWMQRATSESPTFFRSFDESQARRIARTNAQGAYKFDDVAPGGWWVGPHHPGTIQTDPTVEAAPFGEFVAMSGEHIELDIGLVRGLLIRGRLVGADGVTPARGQVHASRPAESLYVDSNGREGSTFVLGPLVPGRWTLQASGATAGMRSAPLEVEAGATDVVLRFLELGRVRLRVVDAAGVPVHAAYVNLASEGRISYSDTDARGEREFPGIAPGPVQASVTTPDGRWAARTGLQIESGGRLEVELVLVNGTRGRLRCDSAEYGTRFSIVHGGVSLGAAYSGCGGGWDVTLPIGSSTLRAHTLRTGDYDLEIVVVAGTNPEFVYDWGWK